MREATASMYEMLRDVLTEKAVTVLWQCCKPNKEASAVVKCIMKDVILFK
jgi:hypothetical protein